MTDRSKRSGTIYGPFPFMDSLNTRIADQRRPSLAVLIAISAVGPLALNIFMPSMPGMVTVFETSPAMVQLTLSLYLIAISVAQLIIGPLSDHFGRRPILLAGMALFLVGTLACRLAPSIDALIVGRIIQGAGGCAGLVLARSVVRDLYSRNKSASMIGYVTMGMAVAPMIGPAIGGYLDGIRGWESSFDLMLAIGVVVFIASYFDLNETNRHRTPDFGFRPALRSYATLSGYGAFWIFALTSSFASGVFFSFLGGAPFIVTDLMHLTPTQYGLYFALVAGGYLTGNFLSGRYAERTGIVAMIMIGNTLSVVAVAAIAIGFAFEFYHPLALFGPMFFTSMANGLTLPNAIAGAVSVRPELAGAAAGLSGSLQVGAGAVASAIVGALIAGEAFGATGWPLVLVMAITSILAFLTGLLCLSMKSLRSAA